MSGQIHVTVAGIVIALGVVAAVVATFYWMLHPPVTTAERTAQQVEREIEEMVGSIIIVFAEEIHSEYMMALAVRVARRERAQLLAVYVIEVPLTLPRNAEMEKEHRKALGVLAGAEAIARANNVEIKTEVVQTRSVSQGVLDLARERDAHLIVIGAYREGKYAGAPLGRSIEAIAASATCDVLIGVQGNRGSLFKNIPAEPEATIPGAG